MSDDEGVFDNDFVEEYSDIEYSENEYESDGEDDQAVNEVAVDEDDKEKEDVGEEETIIELDKDEDEVEKKRSEKVDKDKRITLPYLTKYEKAKVVGSRALQLSQGAKALVNFTKFDPIEIAKKELMNKTLPLIIRRYLPNGKYEDWSLSELEIF